ncbi:MAG TPA: protein-disulfide reductase DsbD domain-containing protein [Acidobacteriaceae bacterium]|nr:protein-disulfide reductase DsbD domain-containing protein [Acidobacteriaceae bacterium]
MHRASRLLRSMLMGRRIAFGVVIPAGNLLFALTLAANAQSSLFDQPKAPKTPPAVAYLFPEQISLPANKPTSVDLHFRIAEGLHINSHTPSGEGLIPTTLALPAAAGVRLAKADFPPGASFSFPINPQEKLSVYTGEFTIHAQFVAAPGDHLVEATLRYQACNNSQCMPPRSIPVTIDVIAK